MSRSHSVVSSMVSPLSPSVSAAAKTYWSLYEHPHTYSGILEDLLPLGCVALVKKNHLRMTEKVIFPQNYAQEWRRSHELCNIGDTHEIIEHGAATASSPRLGFNLWSKQRQQCGEALCFSWLQTGALRETLIRGETIWGLSPAHGIRENVSHLVPDCRTTARRHTLHFPLLCWLLLL